MALNSKHESDAPGLQSHLMFPAPHRDATIRYCFWQMLVGE